MKTEHSSFEKNLIELTGSKLTSSLLRIFSMRSKKVSPSKLLREWEQNRFFTLPNEPAESSKKVEQIFSNYSNKFGFDEIEIPPVCPLGTVSALGPVDQNNVLSSIRGCEVVSDSTNVLALEAALRRREILKKGQSSNEKVKLATSHRLVRAQKFDNPNARSHFKIFSMVTAGRDTGNSEFELGMLEHIEIYANSIAEISGSKNIVLTLFIENEFLKDIFAEKVSSIDIEVIFEKARPSGNGYYKGVSFNIDAIKEGQRVNLVDGGLTDWTAKLLENRKEKLLISGVGIGRAASLV